jgi:CheY-like chemotaxis protein
MNHPTEHGAPAARIRFLESELDRVRAEFASFSGRLSHDLQGIFRNIDGFACALQDQAGGKLADKEARYVQRILAGAQRGESLVRDLASLSAADLAQLQPQALDLAGLVAECIQDLAPGLEGRSVEWELAGQPWPRVEADAALLRLALGHLLGNAVKFTRGRATARIRVGVASNGQEWVIRVVDNGAGFDPAYADRLFRAFERLHLATEFEGNGVGLAMVKLVAQRHGGWVDAEVLPEGGAAFTLALRPQPAPGGLVQRPREPVVAPADRAPRKIRVLVVDDEPLVLATLRTMLERDGHEVVAAGGGAAALQVLEQQAAQARPFDLVVSDWSMPQVGGAEVVLAAKALHPATRAIVLTGRRPDLQGRHDLPAAVDCVLGKPVTPAELRRAVAELDGAGAPS